MRITSSTCFMWLKCYFHIPDRKYLFVLQALYWNNDRSWFFLKLQMVFFFEDHQSLHLILVRSPLNQWLCLYNYMGLYFHRTSNLLVCILVLLPVFPLQMFILIISPATDLLKLIVVFFFFTLTWFSLYINTHLHSSANVAIDQHWNGNQTLHIICQTQFFEYS